MENINESLALLDEIIQGLGKHFGAKFEFVIHDYKSEIERTIVSIANGEVTGRQVGDGPTSIGFRLHSGEKMTSDPCDGEFHYHSRTKDGRLLRSSTIYLHDSQGNIIGSLCVNDDVTEMRQAIEVLMSQVSFNPYQINSPETTDDVVFVGKMGDLLRSMLLDSEKEVGTPCARMTKQQKKEGVQYLLEKGFFKAQRAVELAAEYYNVSKYTIYNYLREIKEETEADRN